MSQNAAAVENKPKPTARKDMTKAQWTLKEIARNKTAYFMLAPFSNFRSSSSWITM